MTSDLKNHWILHRFEKYVKNPWILRSARQILLKMIMEEVQKITISKVKFMWWVWKLYIDEILVCESGQISVGIWSGILLHGTLLKNCMKTRLENDYKDLTNTWKFLEDLAVWTLWLHSSDPKTYQLVKLPEFWCRKMEQKSGMNTEISISSTGLPGYRGKPYRKTKEFVNHTPKPHSKSQTGSKTMWNCTNMCMPYRRPCSCCTKLRHMNGWD